MTWAKVRIALELAFGVIAVIAAIAWYRSVQRAAVGKAQEAHADSVITSVTKQLQETERLSRVVDTVYQHSVTTLHERDTMYLDARDTVIKDIHDTVAVLKFVEASDSLRKACTAVLLNCEQRHHADSLLSHEWQTQAGAWEAKARAGAGRRPSWIASRLALGCGFGAILHAGAVYGGPTCAALIRLFP